MGARILIVEDHPANLELARYLLTHAGHTVRAAMDGLEALAQLESELPNLVICDLQLPGMDGYEVLKRLRAIPGMERLPVIAVTAFSMPDDQRRVQSAGFDGYLSKPIDPELFVAQIEAYLPPC